MTFVEKITIIALVGGPVLSVLAGIFLTRWLENKREDRQRKFSLFKTLMSTRANNLSLTHIESLNVIDVVYADKPEVVSAWRKMLDHLNTTNTDASANLTIWNNKRIELLFQMLHKMAISLGFNLDETQIKNAGYTPIALGTAEAQLSTIRQFIIDLSEGKKNLPVRDGSSNTSFGH